MEIKEQIRLRFKGVDFPSIKLNSSNPYNPEEDGNVEIDIQPKVFIPKDSKNEFNIIMDVKVSVDNCFDLEVTGVGYFELSEKEVEPEVRKQFINANCPAIVFPYVRAFITTITSNLGKVTTPIILPTRFFKGEIPEHSLGENSANL